MIDFPWSHTLQLLKSLPSHIPEASKRYPFRAEPPRIGHDKEYPAGNLTIPAGRFQRKARFLLKTTVIKIDQNEFSWIIFITGGLHRLPFPTAWLDTAAQFHFFPSETTSSPPYFLRLAYSKIPWSFSRRERPTAYGNSHVIWQSKGQKEAYFKKLNYRLQTSTKRRICAFKYKEWYLRVKVFKPSLNTYLNYSSLPIALHFCDKMIRCASERFPWPWYLCHSCH